jgi:hypothetical protein
MTIFGKPLAEYFEFSKVFFGLILMTGIARLALSLGGVPNAAVKWISVSAVVWIAVIYYAIRVHSRGFGTYRHLLPILALLQGVAAQSIIVAGIIIAIITGENNIFSTPEYAFGGDGKTWLHAASHIFVGAPAGTLVGWLVGCLVMFISKKLVRGHGKASTANA